MDLFVLKYKICRCSCAGSDSRSVAVAVQRLKLFTEILEAGFLPFGRENRKKRFAAKTFLLNSKRVTKCYQNENQKVSKGIVRLRTT